MYHGSGLASVLGIHIVEDTDDAEDTDNIVECTAVGADKPNTDTVPWLDMAADRVADRPARFGHMRQGEPWRRLERSGHTSTSIPSRSANLFIAVRKNTVLLTLSAVAAAFISSIRSSSSHRERRTPPLRDAG